MNTWILPQPLRPIEETTMMKLMRSKNRMSHLWTRNT